MTRARRSVVVVCALAALQFLAVFAVTLALRGVILPAYRQATLALTDVPLKTMTPALRLRDTPEGKWMLFRQSSDGGWTKEMSIPEEGLAQIHAGVLLVPALALCTPAPLRRRLRLLLWGSLLLFAVQLFLLIVFVKSWVVFQHSAPQSVLYQTIVWLHSTSGQLAPACIAPVAWSDWRAVFARDVRAERG